MTLTTLCKELNNWFETKKRFGKFKVEDGTIVVPSLQDGQYFRIAGSVFNDGVYKYPVSDLKDEVFDGAIWEMAVPKEIEDLAEEISSWITSNADVLNSPYQSESFGGYSYSKASGTDGGTISWQSNFSSQLNKWRKIR